MAASWVISFATFAAGQPLPQQGHAVATECPAGIPTHALELQQAIARALCTDPRTQQGLALWQARAAQLAQEKAQAWPEVSVTATAGRARQRLREGSDVTVDSAVVGSAALDLSWVLFDFGQQRASTQAAQWSALAAAASQDDTAMEVALATASAFFSLAEAEAVMRVLAQDARFTDEFLAENTRRAAAATPSKPEAPTRRAPGARKRSSTAAAASGQRLRPRERIEQAATPADDEQRLDAELERLQLRADKSRAALERRLARGDLRQARVVLAAQLGLPLHVELSVQADGPGPQTAWAEGSIEELLQEVLRDHPSLRAARARLGAADAGLDLARRSGAPRISLQHSQRAGRDVLRSDSRDATLGVQLEWPLFAGFARKHRESQAQAELAGARAELRGVEQQVALQTLSAYESWQTHAVAVRQARIYEDDAKALLAGEMVSYRAGNSDLHDVLDAHSTVSEASMAHVNSQMALRVARVRLAAALGRLHHAAPGVSGGPGALR